MQRLPPLLMLTNPLPLSNQHPKTNARLEGSRHAAPQRVDREAWLLRAAPLPGRALAVALVLSIESTAWGPGLAPLPRERLRDLGVDRWALRRALHALEEVHLIRVERSGQDVRVEVLDACVTHAVGSEVFGEVTPSVQDGTRTANRASKASEEVVEVASSPGVRSEVESTRSASRPRNGTFGGGADAELVDFVDFDLWRT